MKNTLYIIICSMLLSSCELFVLGSKKAKQVEISQDSPLGTIYLFKAELDSNNIMAASQLLVSPDGSKYLAIEKYELFFEIARLRRLIGSKPVTFIKKDSISSSSYRFLIEFDYLRNISFTTAKIDSNWYIVGLVDDN